MEREVESTGSNRRIGAERKNGLESAGTQTRPFRWLRREPPLSEGYKHTDIATEV